MSLFRNYSRNKGLKSLQQLYAESRKKRRTTRQENAVADDLEQYRDAETWPKTGLQLPSDVQHAVMKRNGSDAFNLECINPFTIITVLTGLSGAGVAACLETWHIAGPTAGSPSENLLGFGEKAEMRLEWFIPYIILLFVLLCSCCCCAGFKATMKSNLQPHIQARFHSCLWLPLKMSKLVSNLNCVLNVSRRQSMSVQALYFLYACDRLPVSSDAQRDLYYELQLPISRKSDSQTPCYPVYDNGQTDTRVIML